jgi:amino acid transporter
MSTPKSPGITHRLKTWILGRSLDPADRSAFHKLSLVAFFAWVGLGADGLSSSAYGPEEMFRALGEHHHLAILLALASALTVFLISATYSQVIELFPNGGGGYGVCSKLLSPRAGLVAGCALLIDYVLTIAISLASASDALFSFLPVEWQPYKLHTALALLALLTLMNSRGVKESVTPLVPIFLVFVLFHFVVLMYGITAHLLDFPTLVRATVDDATRTHQSLGLLGSLVLLLRAFSMGAGTFTGIEAVSNGIPILREPRVKTGKRTMLYMAASLAFMVVALMVAYVMYRVEHVPGKTLNAVLFENITAGWSPALGQWTVWILLFSEAAILFVAAQAGFMDGPRVAANMAMDRWLPNRFSLLSDRLVNRNGILLMGGAAAVTLLLTGASVGYLVVLYSIMVFIDFSLVHVSMARHWWRSRTEPGHWRRRLLIATLGLVVCTFILVMVTILKFFEGGWMTLLALLALLGIATMVRRRYRSTEKALARLNTLVQATQSSETPIPRIRTGEPDAGTPCDPKAKTAVLLVSGFNGLGLHSLFGIIRLFGGLYKNFVFVEVALIDAGAYKGADQVDNLKTHVQEGLDKYAEFVRRHGYHAETATIMSHDVVDGCSRLAPQILARFPQAMFFMGQLVFQEESWISRLFHNNAVFAVQRRLYHLGIPFLVLPIRVKPRD